MKTSSKIITLIFIALFIWLGLIIYFLGSDPSSLSSASSSSNLLKVQKPENIINDKVKSHRRSKTIDFHPNIYPQNLLKSKQFLTNEKTLPKIYDTKYNRFSTSNQPYITWKDSIKELNNYLDILHKKFLSMAGPDVSPVEVWETYLKITKEHAISYDEKMNQNLPPYREDNSIFILISSYRDSYCLMTLKSIFSKAAHPEKIYIGLFQQNCIGPKCRTGVLKGGIVEDAGPDMDCYVEFCNSPEGIASGACKEDENGDTRVRNWLVSEPASLGPYLARYLGSHLYQGEQWYLQIDSHSEFISNWDEELILMIKRARSEKPIITGYPPDSTFKWYGTPGFRMCGAEFAKDKIEWQIVRLNPSNTFEASVGGGYIPSAAEAKTLDLPWANVPILTSDNSTLPLSYNKLPSSSFVSKYQKDHLPCSSPYIAAGFFFAPGYILREVPFDPLLPWIFMGEEVSLSARYYTHGYDLFGPTINVLNHYYVRRHHPKFWETINRLFKKPIHNDLVQILIQRVKHMFNYPESHAETLIIPSILYRINDWAMGRERSLTEYMDWVSLDVNSKVDGPNNWCKTCKFDNKYINYKI